MMVRWLLAAMVGTIALVALLGPPAAIASSAQISVTPVQPIPGERVTVRGSGFCPAPCSAVTVKVDGSVAAGGVAVAPDGTFKVAVGLTPVAGNSTIVASQTDGSGAVRDATAIVHVVPNDQTGPTPTPPPAGTPHPPTASPPRPTASPPRPTTDTTPPTASATVAPSASSTVAPSPSASVSPSPDVALLSSPTSSSGSSDGPPWAVIALIGVIAVVAGGTAIWLRWRRPVAS